MRILHIRCADRACHRVIDGPDVTDEEAKQRASVIARKSVL
jgi:hypothetical protein